MKNLLLLIVCLAFVVRYSQVQAQATGSVSYPYLGIDFTIPEGWVGQEMENGFLIGHQTQPGIAFLTVVQVSSLEEMGRQWKQGIIEPNGTKLMMKGEWKAIAAHALGAQFQGTLEHTAVKAYLIGVYNAFGNSVLVMAAAAPNLYSETHQDVATQLANSLIFSEAKSSPEEAQWREKFTNAKLTYMESYYSGGGSYGGFSTGGGYELTKEIHLCGQGYFKFSGKSSTTIDAGGGFGSSFDRNNGDGQWEIATDPTGSPVLRLAFHDGKIQEYTLRYEDKKTFLNDVRYYVTYASSGPDYAPDCF